MTDHETFSALITQATKLVADENIKQLEISRGKICWIKFSNIKNRQQKRNVPLHGSHVLWSNAYIHCHTTFARFTSDVSCTLKQHPKVPN